MANKVYAKELLDFISDLEVTMDNTVMENILDRRAEFISPYYTPSLKISELARQVLTEIERDTIFYVRNDLDKDSLLYMIKESKILDLYPPLAKYFKMVLLETFAVVYVVQENSQYRNTLSKEAIQESRQTIKYLIDVMYNNETNLANNSNFINGEANGWTSEYGNISVGNSGLVLTSTVGESPVSLSYGLADYVKGAVYTVTYSIQSPVDITMPEDLNTLKVDYDKITDLTASPDRPKTYKATFRTPLDSDTAELKLVFDWLPVDQQVIMPWFTLTKGHYGTSNWEASPDDLIQLTDTQGINTAYTDIMLKLMDINIKLGYIEAQTELIRNDVV